MLGVPVTDEEKDRMRTLYATGQYRQKDVAEMFGLSESTVWLILKGISRADYVRRSKTPVQPKAPEPIKKKHLEEIRVGSSAVFCDWR